MEGLIVFLSLGVGAAAWWWAATWLGRQGKGVVIRHAFGFVAWFLVTPLLVGIGQAAGWVEASESVEEVGSEEPAEPTVEPVEKAPAAKPGPRASPVEEAAREVAPITDVDVLTEDIVDSPIKTQVELRLAVPRDVTREQIEAYLRELYDRQRERTGFESRPSPNAVYAFVFYRGVDYENNPTGWIARVAKSAVDEKPTLDNNVLEGTAVEQARDALGIEDVGNSNGALHVNNDVESDSEGDNDASREISDSMMFATFFIASTLYTKVGVADEVVQTHRYKGEAIGTIRTNRETFGAMRYYEVMESFGKVQEAARDAARTGAITAEEAETREARAERKAYSMLLGRLPEGAVEIERRYRP